MKAPKKAAGNKVASFVEGKKAAPVVKPKSLTPKPKMQKKK